MKEELKVELRELTFKQAASMCENHMDSGGACQIDCPLFLMTNGLTMGEYSECLIGTLLDECHLR